MKILSTPLQGVIIAESSRFIDQRGSFTRLFCAQELSGLLEHRKIVQINHSRTTTKGAIRGMHYQLPPVAETKMVRCLKGKVFDVALDLRADSSTFLQWHAEELTPENGKMFIIPEGCAHGFQTLEEETELLYLHTAYYEPKYEGGVLFNDPAFDIHWPLACDEISDRDAMHKKIDPHFPGINL
ncbi:dTDP-4-dehydrorhamnose 3,5-epimerase [Candidatus Pacearchaeota archaeon]|nr:dTDP-4-dehydrorhamnose 3,5-epimerase [Candidatus Pacearchaeota archaeon]